jgi:DNA-binding CsgD family transcriptional regulator
VPRSLTEAETRVLRAYIDHETHAEASRALTISTQTLKNHLGSIYKKLGVRKAHAAVYRLAVDQGVDPLSRGTDTVAEEQPTDVHLYGGERYAEGVEAAGAE